jgi:hypothetical protein
MKKARLLLLVFLLTQTSLQQLWSTPALIQHFFEHNSGTEKISVLSFLVRHYTEAHEADGHPEKDHSMPFHHADASLQLGIYAPMNQTEFQEFIALVQFEIPTIHRLNTMPLSGVVSAIWQPPRA